MPGKAADPPALMTLIALSGLSVVSQHVPALIGKHRPCVSGGLCARQSVHCRICGGERNIAARDGAVVGSFRQAACDLGRSAAFPRRIAGLPAGFQRLGVLAFRMMQAVIAPAYAVSVAIIRDFSAGNKAASSIGYVAMASAVAPMLAPMLGGTLDELYGWRASFWAFLVMGGATLALCWLDLRETNKTPAATFARQFRSYAKLVGCGRFWGYALCMTFSRGRSSSSSAERRLSPSPRSGFPPRSSVSIWEPSRPALLSAAFLCGRFSERYGLATMMLMGGSVACVGLVLGISLLLRRGEFAVVFLVLLAVLVGNDLAIPSSNAGVVSVRPELAGSASGLSAALTVGGGALLSAITGAVLTEANAAPALLGMMLLSSAIGLLATLYVMRLDAEEKPLERE